MIARATCLSALLLACLCAPAQAASLKVFAAAEDAPLSDGDRWAVLPSQGDMEVVDGRTGARRPVALAQPCDAPFGMPRGVGGALVLVECSFRVNQARPRLLVYDLAARTFTDVPGTEILLRGGDGATVGGIGRTWIAFGINKHRGGSFPGLLNWRTGQVAPEPALAPDRVTDLDAPAATRRICSSIRRPSTRKRLFAYRAPYALTERAAAGARRRLVLERCNGRARTLATMRALGSVAFGPRAVAWVQDGRIHARTLRTGRETSWRAPLGKPVLGLALTGRRLLVTIQGGPLSGPRGFGFTVYRGRLP